MNQGPLFELSSYQVYVSTKFHDFLVGSPVVPTPTAIKQNMISNLQRLCQDPDTDPEIRNISNWLNHMMSETNSYKEYQKRLRRVVIEINNMSSVAALLDLLYLIDPIAATSSKVYYNSLETERTAERLTNTNNTI